MQIYGLIYILDNVPQLLTLQNVSVEANIVDMISEGNNPNFGFQYTVYNTILIIFERYPFFGIILSLKIVKICQTYKNTTSETIEALYKFPTYENSAIYEFEAEIDGDRKIKGIVHEAKEAAQKYKEAISSGYGAYLLEEELSDIFQCSVGNLTPQQTVVIKITYVSELKHDSENERIRFVLPTTIAPRYGSSYGSTLNPGSNDGKVLLPGNSSPVLNATLIVEVTCRMTSMITSIESSSHLITTELNIGGDNKVAKIQLAEDVSYLEKDFVLVAKTSIKSKSTELVFIIDRSGSMS
ncbi:2510_t:CDS:2, partial [Diversispora eburnea]